MKQFAQLPSFFDSLQAADSEGIYYLETDLLSNHKSYRDIPGAPDDAVYFLRYIVLPSCSRTIYKHSSKILTVDGAHVYAKLDGVILTVSVKDASNSLIPLGISYVNIENIKNWSIFYECIVGVFKDFLHLINFPPALRLFIPLQKIFNLLRNLLCYFSCIQAHHIESLKVLILFLCFLQYWY